MKTTNEFKEEVFSVLPAYSLLQGNPGGLKLYGIKCVMIKKAGADYRMRQTQEIYDFQKIMAALDKLYDDGRITRTNKKGIFEVRYARSIYSSAGQ